MSIRRVIHVPRASNAHSLLINEDREDANDDGKHLFAHASVVDLGFGNAWSWSMWVRPTSVSNTLPDLSDPDRWIVQISQASDGNNRIRIDTRNNATDTIGMRVTLQDSSGTTFKDYRYYDTDWPFGTNEAWVHLVLTWDGTNLKAWADGSELTADKVTDDSGTMTNTNRGVTYGFVSPGTNSNLPFRGYLGHTAIWDVALDSTNIAEIHNPGTGTPFQLDLRADSGNYDESSNLVQYWKPGAFRRPSKFGASFNNGYALNDTTWYLGTPDSSRIDLVASDRKEEAPA